MQRPAAGALDRFVDSMVGAGAVSAVVAAVGDGRGMGWWRAAGWARGGGTRSGGVTAQPAEAETWFDFGSLTKPFVATLALLLDRSGELPAGTQVGEVFPGAAGRLAAVTLGDLLRHGVRLAAWTPLYARCVSPAEVEALLLGDALPPSRLGTYSDLDYILWGMAVERALARPLAALVRERVLAPLGLAAGPAPGDVPGVAESRMDGGREVVLAARQGIALAPLPPPAPGQPQDGNGRFLLRLAPGAGMVGHCGLFGTAAALWRLGAEWLAPAALLDREAVSRALAGGGPFALGWWRRRFRGSGGAALSPAAFGHSGFAGGSLWIDPRRARVFVLLGHRIDAGSNLNRWRRRFHAAAVRTLEPNGRQTSNEYP
jgi:serine-type D-Ala-D-Ala carboxypeptidase